MTTPIDMPTHGELGRQIMQRAEILSAFSEPGPGVTRRFGTEEHRQTITHLQTWMEEAGLTATVDAVGNLVGWRRSKRKGAKLLVTGSHQDTVRHGGRYDGMLGILTPISCLHQLHKQETELEYDIAVIAFGDEEGLRFQTTLFGSRAVAGHFPPADLERKDDSGQTVRDVINKFGGNSETISEIHKEYNNISGYVEVHIEQGPVLESRDLPVGVVTAIVGGYRFLIDIQGTAGHAGTVPMGRRQDAMAGAAEITLLAEKLARSRDDDVVATVGMLKVEPNAVNVIPGRVQLSVDLRSGNDERRQELADELKAGIQALCEARNLTCRIDELYAANACQSADRMMDDFTDAIRDEGYDPYRLVSGAGHDGIAFAPVTDIGMLFVRCKDGLSHHPDESITEADADIGARVFLRFLQRYAEGV